MILSPHEIAYVALSVWTPELYGAAAKIIARTAVAVALAESGGDTDALSRSSTAGSGSVGQRDHGLWQISGRWHGEKLQATPHWRDPFVNAVLARQVWQEASKAFTPWSVFNAQPGARPAYEAFLPDADWGIKAPFPPIPYSVVDAEIVDERALHALQAIGVEITGLRAAVDAIRPHFS